MTPITALGSRYGIQGALGRSVKRAAAGGGWWDLNGTITSCVGAWQPKGAASYDASKVNLANPGTYNATDGTDYPTWESATGWTGGVGKYLLLGTLRPPQGDESWSCIVRFSNNPTEIWNVSPMLAAGSGYNRDFGILSGQYGKVLYRNGGAYTLAATASGVACVAGADAYLNGTDIGNLSVAEFTADTGMRFFGNYKSTPDLFFQGSIQAAAVYNATLSSTQVAALSTAMAAL